MDQKLILTALGSGAIAFFTGYNFKTIPQYNDTELALTKQIAAAENSQGGKSSQSSKVNKRSLARKVRSSGHGSRPPVSQVMADMQILLGDSGMRTMDFAAFAESYNLVKNLNEEELLEALTMVQQNSNAQGKMFPIMLLLGRYGEVQPHNAMTYYEENIKSGQLKMMSLNSIVSSWAKNDPQGAFEWYRQKEEDDPTTQRYGDRSSCLNAIFQGLARENLDDALVKLNEIKVDGWKGKMAASGITNSLRGKEDFLYFFEKTGDLENKDIKNAALRSWTARNPQEASEWVLSLEDKGEKKELTDKVLYSWMENDPQKASEWYLNSSDGDSKKALVTVTEAWTRQSPKEAAKWLEEQNLQDNQTAVKTLVQSSTWRDPQLASQWVDKVGDEKEQKRMSKQLYNQWKLNDKKAAEKFLDESPFGEEIRAEFKAKGKKKNKRQ